MPQKKKIKKKTTTLTMVLAVLVIAVTCLNYVLASNIRADIGDQGERIIALDSLISNFTASTSRPSGKDVSNVNIDDLKSTGHSIAALFPVDGVKTQDDAIGVILATGTPDYGPALGISFDDPVNSLNFMAKKLYPSIKQDIKQNNPDIWQRYINLATKPVGISCEFCCGLKAVSVKENGELMCGCQHNPAMHGLTLWLMKNTDYTDVEIVREDLKWKALWYPKDMVKLTLQVAGGDTSSLEDLPGMVGGC